MSNAYVATNKGSTTVGANFIATDTAFTVATGEGVRLPSPTGGDYTLLVLQNTAGVREIICVVGRTGDVCTVGIPGSAAPNVAGRNYEAIYGMGAAAWVIGDVVSCRPTAALSVAAAAAPAAAAAALAAAVAVIPATTAMLFQQTAAPVGWTKVTTHNDKALRVVSGVAGSGGTVAFSTVFGKTATDGHAVSAAEMPTHNHGVSDPGHTHGVSDPGHAHALDGGWSQADGYVAGRAAGGGYTNYGGAVPTSSVATGISIGAAATGISTANAGSGSAHTHGIDIRVQYVDTIIATKD